MALAVMSLEIKRLQEDLERLAEDTEKRFDLLPEKFAAKEKTELAVKAVFTVISMTLVAVLVAVLSVFVPKWTVSPLGPMQPSTQSSSSSGQHSP